MQSMQSGPSTCWDMIRGASEGNQTDREQFAWSYAPVIRGYLVARWKGRSRTDADDAVQEVFVECFRQGGVLERVESGRPGGFRAFLYGVVRNVALRFEAQRFKQRETRLLAEVPEAAMVQEDVLARVFDQEWAKAILRAAALRQKELARKDAAALKRVDLLTSRFEEGLPIRDIARAWQVDPDQLHREYARAKEEFRDALFEVLTFHHPSATRGEVERECTELLSLFR
jgi:RNA polymerase sigma factor (sigma-70 family)